MEAQDDAEQVLFRPAGAMQLLLWSFLLLVLLPLLANSLFPELPESRAGLKRGAHAHNEPLTFVLSDGRRLVCVRCGQLSATPPGVLSQAAALWRALGRSRIRLAWQAHAASAPAVPAAPAAPHRLQSYAGAGNLRDDVAALLPAYRADFETAARRYGQDWRLLAAIGYQESRWNPAAESPTGVRGLMMLTTGTALDMGVDREDGKQSIFGASRFLQSLYQQLPPQIREPDRTAMALAAYNQGIGHLLDAREIAAQMKGNPDRWADVRSALLLLGDEDYSATTRYGYARGSEAVSFVDSVRQYYAELGPLTAPATAQSGKPKRTDAG